jgi:hypothetical protein
VDAGADRVPLGVGQPDPGDERVARPQGLLDEARIDVDQAQLGPAEQVQRPVDAPMSVNGSDDVLVL